MKTWIKRTLIAVASLSLLGGGFAAFAHRDHHGHGWRVISADDAAAFKARIIERAARRLDLDATQKASLGVLADRLREQRNAMIGDTTDPRAALQALVAGPTFDRAGALSLLTAKTDALRQGAPVVLDALADFYDGLRPEQQAKLRELMQRGGHGRWHGRDHERS
jgi:protein CpxP